MDFLQSAMSHHILETCWAKNPHIKTRTINICPKPPYYHPLFIADPFIKMHLFETSAFLLDAVKLHFTEEMKSQAVKIFGSVDFLGNPLGLVNDVAAGVSGLLIEGNVGGLIKNITHGVTNSAAKVG